MSRNVWAASAVAMMVVVTACGGGGSGVTGPSTPTTPTPTPASGPRAVVRGMVIDGIQEDTVPVAGASVSVPGSSVSTTSAADGTFSIEVPVGSVTLRVTSAGRWGALTVLDVPAAGLSDLEFPVIPDSTMSATSGVLGRGISASNGMVLVAFENESGLGGESASITAASDPGTTISSQGAYVQSSSLLPDGGGAVFFTNVAPGSTGTAVAGAAGRNTCSIFGTSASSWPVEAKTTTYVFASCR
jgi:hypothetical protein